jgi:hypothetical protein
MLEPLPQDVFIDEKRGADPLPSVSQIDVAPASPKPR